MHIAIRLQVSELKSREFRKPGAKGRSGFQFSVAVFGFVVAGGIEVNAIERDAVYCEHLKRCVGGRMRRA
jgi:hypothetical protein